MEAIITAPGWVDIKNACQELATKIKEQDLDIKYIVGITRGGLTPAVIMSHIMDIPTVPISYSSQTGKGDNRYYNNDLPDVQSTIDESRIISGSPAILIIDDISDSGQTLADVSAYYSEQGHRVTTVALYYKEGSVFTPDFFWQHVSKDSGWITFPWEG